MVPDPLLLNNGEDELCLEEITVHGYDEGAALQLCETSRDAQSESAAFSVCAGTVPSDKALGQFVTGDI